MLTIFLKLWMTRVISRLSDFPAIAEFFPISLECFRQNRKLVREWRLFCIWAKPQRWGKACPVCLTGLVIDIVSFY